MQPHLDFYKGGWFSKSAQEISVLISQTTSYGLTSDENLLLTNIKLGNVDASSGQQ